MTQDKFGPTTFTGEGVNAYRAVVLASGLRMWAQSGMIPNRSYTITRMLAAAEGMLGAKLTGTRKVKALLAAEMLTAYAHDLAARARAVDED